MLVALTVAMFITSVVKVLFAQPQFAFSDEAYDNDIFKCAAYNRDIGFGFPSFEAVTQLTVLLSLYLMSFHVDYTDEPRNGSMVTLSPTTGQPVSNYGGSDVYAMRQSP